MTTRKKNGADPVRAPKPVEKMPDEDQVGPATSGLSLFVGPIAAFIVVPALICYVLARILP
jgi:hypothetical protein